MGGTKIATHLINAEKDVVWQAQQPTAKGTDLVPAVCQMIEKALT